MSLENELNALALHREQEYELILADTIQEPPNKLLRQLRAYLAELTDHGKLKQTYESPRSEARTEGATELICDHVEFASDSVLSFSILLVPRQLGWLLKQFEFHLAIVARGVRHVRIHLTATGAYNPLKVPRCHIHLDNSDPHIPFPIMNPRLILHLICEHIEPDIGREPE